MEIQFPTDAQLLAYADDLQLVATGPNRHVNAQSALDSIEKACRD